MKTERKRGIRGIGNVITAAVFAAVLCAFLVMSLMADDREFSENENRYLAEMPEAMHCVDSRRFVRKRI